jgi:hypothetical protein
MLGLGVRRIVDALEDTRLLYRLIGHAVASDHLLNCAAHTVCSALMSLIAPHTLSARL